MKTGNRKPITPVTPPFLDYANCDKCDFEVRDEVVQKMMRSEMMIG